MAADDAPSNRCGYTLAAASEYELIPQLSCYRPVWEDHDYCVWHAPDDGKDRELLEDAAPSPNEHLDGAYLNGVNLIGVNWFADVSLVQADFREADIRGIDCSGAVLQHARFHETLASDADFSTANLEGARITETDLRGATFVDARLNEAILKDLYIDPHTEFGEQSIYEKEQSAPPAIAETHSLRAAAWVYRELQQVYDENSFPELVRRSYRQEKDARRRLAWAENDYANAIKYELSRWVMRYGSSPYRILWVSAVVILVCGVLYPLTGGIQITADEQTITYTLANPEEASRWWLAHVFVRSLYFSLVTFTTLGYGDIQPIGMWARILAGIEAGVGTLLAALLVFVLIRSVTW